jgi:hypothetical protein
MLQSWEEITPFSITAQESYRNQASVCTARGRLLGRSVEINVLFEPVEGDFHQKAFNPSFFRRTKTSCQGWLHPLHALSVALGLCFLLPVLQCKSVQQPNRGLAFAT